MSRCSGRRPAVRGLVLGSLLPLLARTYFELSYRLLAGSVAGLRILTLSAAGDYPVHGYFTLEDLEVLLESLDPGPGQRLLDLGCGIGGVALEVHRRSGAQITGVDISSAAVAAAIARASRAGVGESIAFVVGDLRHPPLVGATRAYAVDSLMFVPDLADALRNIGDVLGPDGRLVVTLLVIGPGAERHLRHSLRMAGAQVERLDDVTPGLGAQSRARASAAQAVGRESRLSARGRLAVRLVMAEEALVGWLTGNGRLSRWRVVARYTPASEGDAVRRHVAQTSN